MAARIAADGVPSLPLVSSSIVAIRTSRSWSAGGRNPRAHASPSASPNSPNGCRFALEVISVVACSRSVGSPLAKVGQDFAVRLADGGRLVEVAGNDRGRCRRDRFRRLGLQFPVRLRCLVHLAQASRRVRPRSGCALMIAIGVGRVASGSPLAGSSMRSSVVSVRSQCGRPTPPWHHCRRRRCRPAR